MKNVILISAMAAALLCSCGGSNQKNAFDNPVLDIQGGSIQGITNADSTVLIYRGIPYATPPVGDLRWKKPQPVKAWTGVKVADTFGNASYQGPKNPNDGEYGTEFYPENPVYSEDCLYLNVWTPAGAPASGEKLPVAMWIHGGGYNVGWGYELPMDGEAWANKGVILVTINYRVGMFGFMNHPLLTAEGGGHSGNYGLYDQIAALKWINDNISAFGGDPSNITVFGQSAGAGSVKNVVSSPLSKGMVARAIIQSGGGLGSGMPQITIPQEALDAPSKKFFDAAGYDTLEKLRGASFEELMAALPDWRSPESVRFGPHNDSEVLPEDFNVATMNGHIADIPYMMGHCGDDMPGMENGEKRFAQVRDSLSTNPVFLYLFNRPLPSDGRPSLKGSFHSSELWYVFGTLSRSWRPFTKGDYALSDEMVTCWTNFCKYGDPNGENGGNWKSAKGEECFVKEFKVVE
ncbi:MAG: carboxylesterase family protein [Bacteroidales bacterium]|nr:carboxylesterase family protein [Bacteroidales bacterium]